MGEGSEQGVRRVHLEVITESMAEEDDAALARRLGADLGACAELARGVIAQTLALARRDPRSAPWGGYLATDPDARRVIGTCGFTGGPDRDGAVEIAYFTFPPFEGRGCATAMARALLSIALAAPEVRWVVAHTLPEPNASTRVLAKVGFRRAGDAVDPDAGAVWRWALATR